MTQLLLFTSLFLVIVMAELRSEIPNETLAVMDAYCSATGLCRTQLTQEILGEWAAKKLHVSTIVCRVAGVNPTQPERRRRKD